MIIHWIIFQKDLHLFLLLDVGIEITIEINLDYFEK